ncbi:helix-turn-helix domain-containing protein [Microbacterium sp.]|uniref:helix-turn-helix domain-containing protein n=1 Tax=Actinomycetes TaxID=1760 RepID=UPI0037CA9EF7
MTGEKMTVSEVARVFGVTPGTVRRWADDPEKLPSSRTLGGARRFDREVIDQLLRDARG